MIEFTADQMRQLADVHEATGRPQSAKQLRAMADRKDAAKLKVEAAIEQLEAHK